MRSSAVSQGQTADASQYNNLRLDAEAASYLLAHEKGTPDMQLYVEAGVFKINGNIVEFAGGNSPSFTAPVSNNRIDVLTINSAGTLEVTQGSAAASPSAPSVPSGKLPICYVYLRSTSTTLRDDDGGAATGYILRDLRPFLDLPSSGGGMNNITCTLNPDGSIATLTDADQSKTYTFTYATGGRLSSWTDGTNTWTITYNDYGFITAIAKT